MSFPIIYSSDILPMLCPKPMEYNFAYIGDLYFPLALVYVVYSNIGAKCIGYSAPSHIASLEIISFLDMLNSSSFIT